ncbi:hypothetical protein ACFL04_02365 [Patescibacteria group bacterium]
MPEDNNNNSNSIIFVSIIVVVVIFIFIAIVYLVNSDSENSNSVVANTTGNTNTTATVNVNNNNVNTSGVTAVTGQVFILSDVGSIPDTIYTDGVVAILTMDQAIATLNFLGQETGRPLIAPSSILTDKNIEEAGFESVGLNNLGEYYYVLIPDDYVVCVADPFTEIDGVTVSGITILSCQEATITQGEQLQLDFELGF